MDTPAHLVADATANMPQNILFQHKWFAYTAIGVLFIGGCFLAYNKYVDNKRIHLEQLINRYALDEYRKNKSEEEKQRIEKPTDYVEKVTDRLFGKV